MSTFKFTEVHSISQILINDLKVSFALRNQYESMKRSENRVVSGSRNSYSQLEFNVKLLRGDFWDMKVPEIKRLPKAVLESRKEYIKLLGSKFKERKYSWILDHGTAVVKFTTDRWRNLVMNKLQACILMLFNENKALTFLQISKFLDYDDKEELVGSLLGLLKTKILKSSGPVEPSKLAESPNLFYVNTNFTHKRVQVKVKQPKRSEKKEENKIQSELEVA